MYSAEAAVPATTDACRNVFLAKGWVPYGVAGDSAFFKQNAILVTATVSSAPAQGREGHDPVFDAVNFG